MDGEGLRPRTPREGLLLIRSELGEDHFADRLRVIIDEALDGLSGDDDELTEQLADRLAEAHHVLKEVTHVVTCDWSPDLVGAITAALALPPHLKAIVEHRLSRG